MKLTKDRFTCWECIDDNDYEEKYDDELIISVKEGETNRDIADYILECQEKAEKWDKVVDHKDFAEYKKCGLCNESIAIKTGENESYCVKSSILCHVCTECEDKFENLEAENKSLKEKQRHHVGQNQQLRDKVDELENEMDKKLMFEDMGIIRNLEKENKQLKEKLEKIKVKLKEIDSEEGHDVMFCSVEWIEEILGDES